jgi:putative DNA primase/helicase
LNSQGGKYEIRRAFDDISIYGNWAIAGWFRLARFGAFRQPQSAADAVEALEDLSSPINAFIRERCVIEPRCFVGVTTIFEAWRAWCEAQGRDKPGTAQSFGRDLRAAVPNLKLNQRREDDRRTRYYEGIELR